MWTIFGIPVLLLVFLAIVKLAMGGGRRSGPTGSSRAPTGLGIGHFVIPYLVSFGLIGAVGGYLGWGWEGLKVGGLGGVVLATVVGSINKALYDAVA